MDDMSSPFRVYSPVLILVICLLVVSSCSPAPAFVTTSPTASLFTTDTEIPTLFSTQTPWVITTTPQQLDPDPASPQGMFVLSLPDGGYYHLFAYSPETLPLTRLTANNWDDIEPALSPNGNLLAYTSRQNGYWDIYLLDLQIGSTRRLTDSLTWDSAPSWSPDGAWLVHETAGPGSLELVLSPVVDTTFESHPLDLRHLSGYLACLVACCQADRFHLKPFW